jgi:ubiquitin-protein ligase
MSKVTYSNTLSPIARTRVAADRNLVLKDQEGYQTSDIYFNFRKDKIDNLFRILMIGSKDLNNPYFGGFFMFQGKFPDQYPFFPPHVLAKTQGENTRFHPNYYVNGKCCLSILGTWSGPPWTSCQNLGTVSQSLKMLFIDNPITQEPSWEKCTDERAKTYTRIIAYRTLQVAVLNMLNKPPNNFENFLPIMEKNFIQLYPKYMEKIKTMKKLHGKTEKSPIYGMKVTYDIDFLEKSFKNTYLKLYPKYGKEEEKKFSKKYSEKLEISNNHINSVNMINSDESLDLNTSITSNDIKEIKQHIKKSKKRVPNKAAKNFEEGYSMISENSGDTYKVIKTLKGHKRWKKILQNVSI